MTIRPCPSGINNAVARLERHSVMSTDVRFKHPFTCIVAGPTGSGKSTFSAISAESQDSVPNASTREASFGFSVKRPLFRRKCRTN